MNQVSLCFDRRKFHLAFGRKCQYLTVYRRRIQTFHQTTEV